MSKKRFSIPIDELPPGSSTPPFPWVEERHLPYFDHKTWSDEVCDLYAEAIAERVNRECPRNPKTGKRGRPKDQRAYLAGALMRGQYEFWTGQKIGRTNHDGEYGGPYYRSIERVLKAIRSDTDPLTLISAHIQADKRLKSDDSSAGQGPNQPSLPRIILK